ncbi:hypothetical protein C6361_31835 [Plantactinospora sp. BC1]|nr:hypothetical protein C6361_31835 [Plantactinospora sp. BC1]
MHRAERARSATRSAAAALANPVTVTSMIVVARSTEVNEAIGLTSTSPAKIGSGGVNDSPGRASAVNNRHGVICTEASSSSARSDGGGTVPRDRTVVARAASTASGWYGGPGATLGGAVEAGGGVGGTGRLGWAVPGCGVQATRASSAVPTASAGAVRIRPPIRAVRAA